MKNLILALGLLIALTAVNPAVADTARHASAAPRAASIVGGSYICPVGWSLVTTAQYVTYYSLQTQLVCSGFGCYYATVYVPVTVLVPANYCVATLFR